MPLLTRRRLALILFFSIVLISGCRAGGIRHNTPFVPTPVVHSGWSESALTLDLAECLQMALERNPRVATQRTALAAAEDNKRGLDRLHLPATLDSQVPIRRQQAALGLTAAAAGLTQAEKETAYAVTRTYYTVLYAREQEALTRKVVERLTATLEATKQGLEAGAREVTSSDVSRTIVYLKLAETRRVQATQGVKRAKVALREAIGLGAETTLDIPAGQWVEPTVQPNRQEIVAAALKCRGDLIQATIFAQVAALEVEAQATSRAQRMQTFASGSDIHSTQVPDGSNGTEYRPGAKPPEMPAMLVGSRAERMKHAETLSARAVNVVATTKNLITLEAEDAYLRWEEASNQARIAKEAAEAGEKLADDYRKDFAAGLKVKVEEVITSRVLASQARSEYNEYLYKQIVALADLERITAGAFQAGLRK
ncbi:MAG: TolC family protein [Planctomycetes bacterium]|nr:TolC family protein [Planctomycetota bacterium]